MTRHDVGGDWHVITCEYPPAVGGLGDYVAAVSNALARAGDRVHVWAPGRAGTEETPAGVAVHRALGRFGPLALWHVGRAMRQAGTPRRLLVHWVPHGYGFRSLNVIFSLWVLARARVHGDRLEVIVHEPFLEFAGALSRQSLAAAVHRLMLRAILTGAARVWVPIPAWAALIAPHMPPHLEPPRWVPVPGLLPVVDDRPGVAALRRSLLGGRRALVGHFGTFGRPVADLLEPAVAAVLQARPDLAVVLAGRGSDGFARRLSQRHPQAAGRVHATGVLSAGMLSRLLQACDVFLQPYPDGVSGRRTTLTALVAHGCAVVSTEGHLTEPFWRGTAAVRLCPVGDARALADEVVALLDSPGDCLTLAARARDLYEQR
ncbi:MAG TPA: glycosyltransferase family 4 protein, partial [Methylomirabilota bacterium]